MYRRFSLLYTDALFTSRLCYIGFVHLLVGSMFYDPATLALKKNLSIKVFTFCFGRKNKHVVNLSHPIVAHWLGREGGHLSIWIDDTDQHSIYKFLESHWPWNILWNIIQLGLKYHSHQYFRVIQLLQSKWSLNTSRPRKIYLQC